MVIAPDPIKGGFKKVGATTTQGREVLKKSISTDELLDNQKKILKNTKKTKKPNLFSRIKGKLKDFHKFMVKDAGYRKTSKFAGYGRNVTRNTFKNTMRGNTMRAINKVLPGKYKALAALAVGTYLATRPKKGDGAGGKGKIKRYTAYQKPLGFDTGKENEGKK